MPQSWMLSIASDFLSNSFLGEIPDLLGLQPLHGCGIVGSVCLPPCSRHRCARRQHEVIEDVTARAVNIAGSQVFMRLKFLLVFLAAFLAADCFANNDVQIESLFGKSQAQIQEFALQNHLIAIDVLGKNTIALHKTERISVCGIKPMVILLNFDGDACNSIQITAKTLSENDVKKLESKVKAKITVQQVEFFGICNVFISKL